jgi:hypothetical protein
VYLVVKSMRPRLDYFPDYDCCHEIIETLFGGVGLLIV